MKHLIEISGKYITKLPYNLPIPEGYEKDINTITGNNFPHCCNFHKSIFETSRTKLKSENDELAHKIVNQVSYTEFILSTCLSKADWYDEITEYIQFSIDSFGHPSTGAGYYINSIHHFFETSQPKTYKFTDEQRKKLLEFTNNCINPTQTEPTSLNQLIDIYNKWLDIFPFNIEYFSEIGKKLEKTLPFLSEAPKTNRFNGIAYAKVITTKKFYDFLFSLTKIILNSVTDTNRKQVINSSHLIELISENHKLKQEALLNELTSTEKQITQILIQWLENEKDYFKELLSLPDFKTIQKTNEPIKNPPKSFNEAFTVKDWKKYIEILTTIENPILDKEWNFIGSPRKHKGVICNWLETLRVKNIIQREITRQLLAEIVNNEIKGINLGTDGRSFGLDSIEYRNNYEKILEQLLAS